MGQWTTGLLYGCEKPSGVDWYGEEEDSPPDYRGVSRACAEAFADEIAALSKSGKLKNYERAEKRFVPDWETCGDADLLGFWVAAGASGKPGCPSLNRAVPVAEIRTCKAYRVAYKNARVRWRRFAKWAASQGIVLPKARLYLTETEVA